MGSEALDLNQGTEEQEPLTDEQARQAREEAVKEFWGEDYAAGDDEHAPPADNETIPTKTVKEPPPAKEPAEKEPEPDPWKGVHPDIKKQFEDMKSLTENMSERLKQGEKRIGALTNELHNAQEAAKTLQQEKDNAPTQAEIDAAAKSKENWEELKAEFPEWAKATEELLAAQSAEFEKKLAALPKPKTDEDATTLAEFKGELIDEFVESFHPKWKEKVQSKDYADWLTLQDDDIKQKHYHGTRAADAIFVLNKFDESKGGSGGGKTVAEIAAERERRLAGSEIPSSGKTRIPPKSDDDMTDLEYRRKLAEKWDDL